MTDEIERLRAELAAAKRAWECAIEERNEHHAAELNALERAEAAEAERDALRAERDALRGELKAALVRQEYFDEELEVAEGRIWEEITTADATIIDLRARLDEALEALGPFVALAHINWVGTMFEGGRDEDDVFYHHASGTRLTLGDFRRARAVYEKIKGGGDE